MLEKPEVFGERVLKQLKEMRDQKVADEQRRIHAERVAAAEPQSVRDQKRADKVLEGLEARIFKEAAHWGAGILGQYLCVMPLPNGDCVKHDPYPTTGTSMDPADLTGAGRIVFDFCAQAGLNPFVMFMQRDETAWSDTGFSIYIRPLPSV